MDVGANRDIRAFEPAAAPIQRSLLDETVDRTPTIARLLSTPWVSRGADIERTPPERRAPNSTGERIDVSTDPAGGPRRFTREPVASPARTLRQPPRHYTVERVVSYWVEDHGWFTPERHVRRYHYRVLARRDRTAPPSPGMPAEVFNLSHDVRDGGWTLEPEA